MENRNVNKLIIEVIITIILILYVLFLYLDLCSADYLISSAYIKYLCILLCFGLSIFNNKNLLIDIDNNRDIFLLQLALFITVIADLCLVILNYFILGLVFFSMDQITYCVRYTNKKLKTILKEFFIIFLCIVFLYSIADIFIEGINILLPLSVFYCICLITSVSKAIIAFKNNLYPSPSKYFIVFGMLLFLLCDICVALYNMTMFLPSNLFYIHSFQQIICFMIWVFYLPSQLLLALSGSQKDSM